MDFAVWHEGVPDDKDGNKQGRWVLAIIDGSHFLLSEDDGTLYTMELVDCKLVRVHTPDAPIPVVPVQMQQQQQNGLIVAEPNRAMRRNGGF